MLITVTDITALVSVAVNVAVLTYAGRAAYQYAEKSGMTSTFCIEPFKSMVVITQRQPLPSLKNQIRKRL